MSRDWSCGVSCDFGLAALVKNTPYSERQLPLQPSRRKQTQERCRNSLRLLPNSDDEACSVSLHYVVRVQLGYRGRNSS